PRMSAEVPEPQQQQPPEQPGSQQGFSLAELTASFNRCRAQPGLGLAAYADGYDQLLHFLRSLNKAFYFVVQDVDSKLRILRSHIVGPEAASFSSIAGMLQFESAGGFAGKENGSRTLLRLHRALLFLVLLLDRLVSAPADKSISSIAGESYNESLANHHPWAVRKAVGLALYLLPSRETLLANMAQQNACDAAGVRQLVTEAVPCLKDVYDQTQRLYSEAKALELP
ncbi:hypothetical protein BOX15_Mlig000594g4, partial [Macrostomum lignano]